MFGMPDDYDSFNQAQPNQYSDGNLGNVNNTQWMQPSGSGDSTLAQGDQFNPSNGSSWTGGISGNGESPNQIQQPQSSPSMLPPAATAIEATQNGWGFYPNDNTNGGIRNIGGWQDGKYYDYGMTPPGGWNTDKNATVNQPANNQPQGFGAPPLGFDADKWNDPNQGTSLKYQVGRMAAQGVPIDQIAAKVGAKVISPDKIQYPDGFIADIYFDYGGPNQRVQYTDVTPEGQYKPGSAPTMNNQTGNLAMNQQNPFGMDINQMMQQMMFMQNQAKRGTVAARTKRLRGYGAGGPINAGVLT